MTMKLLLLSMLCVLNFGCDKATERKVVVADLLADAKAAYFKQDYATALSKFTLAAAQGDAYAQYNLALMYDNGHGVTQDHHLARMWRNVAAASRDTDRIKSRDSIAAEMTPQQLAEAQKIARRCQDTTFKDCD